MGKARRAMLKDNTDKSDSLSKFHIQKDGNRGWDYYDDKGHKIYIRGTDISRNDPRNRGILSSILNKIFGTNKDDD